MEIKTDGKGASFSHDLIGGEHLAVLCDDTAVLVVDSSTESTVARTFGKTVEEQAASVTSEVAADVRNRATVVLSRVT